MKTIRSHIVALLLFALPSSGNYQMHDFGFGSGGSGVAESGNYASVSITGEPSSLLLQGSLYDLGPGLQFTRQTNTPAAPTFSNPANYYNKLQFVVDTGSNPTDTLFAIAISTDDFVTTNFIQADGTIAASAVYQTYTDWGGASGELVIGLATSTTYKIKVKAVQTKYTESSYSAASTASTSAPSLTYDLDVASTDTESAPPYTVAFGTLTVGSVTTATDRIWVDISTNASGGAFVYLYTLGSGLTSVEAGYTLTSTTADLTSELEGYGAQVASVSQSSGGPLVAVSPYDGAGQNVGILNTTSRTIFSTSAAPISAGRGSVYLKAKASITTPSASDYSDTILLIASSTF